VSLTFLTDHTSPPLRDLDERIVREWNKRRPDTPVTLSVLDHEELKSDLERLLTDDRPPDVMTWFAGNRMRSFIDRGLMLDTADLWRPGNVAESYDRRFQPDNGSAYHLPTSHYWWAVYYRPSVLRSLGIATPIRTWTELRIAVTALRAAGIAPFALGTRHGCPAAAWFDYLDLRLNGPRCHRDLMALRTPYTDDRVRRVFTFWRRLLDEGWFLGDPTEYDEEAAMDAVLRGTAGMTLIGAYVHDEYVAENESDLDFYRFPIIDPALPVGEDAPVDGYFVAGRSAEPASAITFLAHLASREVQQWTAETLTALPTRTDVDIERGGPHLAKGMALLRQADDLSQFYDLDTPWELAEFGTRAFVSFLHDPSRVDELLREIEDRRLALLGT
jgi:ABC-type glycerol-3-phosphate transport system substrate-binding protein